MFQARAACSCLAIALVILVFLLADVWTDASVGAAARDLGELPERSSTAPGPPRAGIFKALRGTFWIGVFTVLSFPLGIAAAVYLEEYASRCLASPNFINVNIRNLSGVPSVVYGIFGLTILVQNAGRLHRRARP